MRRWLLFLILIPVTLAQTLTPVSVHIQVQAGEGVAKVSEYYTFTPDDSNTLKHTASLIGFRYYLWKDKVEGLQPHVCKRIDDDHIIIKYVDTPTLTFSYTCKVTKVSEDLFSTSYEISSFSFPVMGGFVVLPENYELEVNIPPNGQFLIVSPDPYGISKNWVIWRGPVSTASRFRVVYSVPKIYTSPSISLIIVEYGKDPRVLIMALAIIIVLYYSRDKIKETIVHLVSSTTEITKE